MCCIFLFLGTSPETYCFVASMPRFHSPPLASVCDNKDCRKTQRNLLDLYKTSREKNEFLKAKWNLAWKKHADIVTRKNRSLTQTRAELEKAKEKYFITESHRILSQNRLTELLSNAKKAQSQIAELKAEKIEADTTICVLRKKVRRQHEQIHNLLQEQLQPPVAVVQKENQLLKRKHTELPVPGTKLLVPSGATFARFLPPPPPPPIKMMSNNR